MRIAILSPLYESVPPQMYGGTERVVATLCEGLERLGHDVTLFASGDSIVSCELVPVVEHATRLAGIDDATAAAYHVCMQAAVAARMGDFDIIHNNLEFFGFTLGLIPGPPIVTTLHNRIDRAETLSVLKAFEGASLVSISLSQRAPAPHHNWVANVYHGIDIDRFQFSPVPGKYLAFLGRISPEKRPDLAIEIARRAQVPLKIAAKVDPAEREYFENVIRPEIDGRDIEYVGEIAEHQKSAFLGGALGLLFPIEWPEPFGLAPLEAWACGTPVLARPYGAVPELHRDGVSGYVRETAAELTEMVPALASFDRRACRDYAAERFSARRMCADYIRVFESLVEQPLPHPRGTWFTP